MGSLKVEGLGEARAKKIRKMLESKSKFLKKSNQKTLHDTWQFICW